MKILLISTTAFPVSSSSHYPTEKLIYQLAQGLQQRGHQVTVAATTESVVPEGVELLPTIPSVAAPTAQSDALAHRIVRDMFPAFDIIHDHSHFLYSYLYKANQPALPLCATLHGWQQFTTPPTRVLYPNFVCLSQKQAESYQLACGVNCRVVRPAVDINEFRFSAEKGDRLLFLSPIIPEKGALQAIDIARRAKVPLDVAGIDRFTPDVGYVHRCMDSCDGSQIKYWGQVDQGQRKRFLAEAKALIFPAVNEPFGLVGLEALASGTAIICLKGSGIEETVTRKTGFACGSYDEMVDAICRVDGIKPEDCRKRAEQFSLSTMASKYERLYHEACGEGW